MLVSERTEKDCMIVDTNIQCKAKKLDRDLYFDDAIHVLSSFIPLSIMVISDKI